MSETQFGRDLCATERHIFEDGPTCLRCGEPAPAIDEATKQAADKLRATMADLRQVSAPMPERVWPTRWTPWSLLVSAFNYAIAIEKDAESAELFFTRRDDLAREVADLLETKLVPESRLLAAEARVREVEEQLAAIEAVVRRVEACPIENNDGIEPDEGTYICYNEDGDPIIQADTLTEAVEGIVQCWNATAAGYEKAHERADTLRAERDALVPLARYAAPVWVDAGMMNDRIRAILDRSGA